MFHTYVLNANAVPIDLDRATFLMDKRLWWSVCGDLHERGETDPQMFFTEYGERHEAKYGKPFAPVIATAPL